MKLSIAIQAVMILSLSPTCHAQGGFLENVFGSFGAEPSAARQGGNNGSNGNGNGNNGNGNGNGNAKSFSVKAKDCKGSKCTIDTSALDINDDVESISFELTGSGHTTKCKKVERGNSGKAAKWVGKCDGGGSANLVQRGTNSKGEALLYGSVVDLDTKDICRFTPDAEGNNGAICTPAADYPAEAEAKSVVEEEQVVVVDDDGRLRKLVADPSKKPSSSFLPKTFGLKGSVPVINMKNQTRRGLLDDSGGNLDILVVWTKTSECKNSNLGAGCTTTITTNNNMLGLIDAAIAETNEAYINSGVETSLRLVHAYRDPDYSEAAGFNAALDAITYKNDGDMDDVHQKRTEYGADIVALIIDNTQYCGIGWIGPRIDLMFSVTDYRCMSGSYTFAHEVGHNMGCLHDRGTENECTAPGYTYGYRDPQARFRSIMAYNCRTGQCDNIGGRSCPRALMFSNDDFDVDGAPIGNAQNDNARQIDEVKATIAGYYPFQATCEQDSDCTTSDLCAPGVCDGVCAYPPIDCTDNDACTEDSCDGGNCINDAITCDDDNECTNDSCDSTEGCVFSPIPGCCGNGICDGTEDSQSCPQDCFEGPFALSTDLCSSCFIRDGLMFDIEAMTDLEIRSFNLYAYTSGTAEIWTRPGTHVEHEFSDSGWTKVADHVFTTGAFQLVEIPETSFTEYIPIASGSRQAFYVTLQTNQDLLYLAGQGSTDAVNAENSDMRVYEGPAKNYLFGAQTGPRKWNGEVVYVKSVDVPNPSSTTAIAATTTLATTPAPAEAPTPAPVTPAPVEDPTPAPVTPAPVEDPTPATATPAPVEDPTPAPVVAPTTAPPTNCRASGFSCINWNCGSGNNNWWCCCSGLDCAGGFSGTCV